MKVKDIIQRLKRLDPEKDFLDLCSQEYFFCDINCCDDCIFDKIMDESVTIDKLK